MPRPSQNEDLMRLRIDALERVQTERTEATRIEITQTESRLRQHIDNQRESVMLALSAEQKLQHERDAARVASATMIAEQLSKSDQMLESRLTAMNQFREQIMAEREQFARKDTLNAAGANWNQRHDDILLRIISLENRPLSLPLETQTEMHSQLRDRTGILADLRTKTHELANAVQLINLSPPLFTEDERIEIRRLLKLAAKFEVDDGLTPVEMDELHRFIKERQSGQTMRAGRRTTLENALIGTVVGALSIAVLVPTIGHLITLVH